MTPEERELFSDIAAWFDRCLDDYVDNDYLNSNGWKHAEALRRRLTDMLHRGTWRDIKTIPLDRRVVIRTRRGLVRIARVKQGEEPRRILRGEGCLCWNEEPGMARGELIATAWKEET